MRWAGDTQSSLGARLRTLLVLFVVVALVAMVALGSGTAPAWLHLGSPSAAGGSVHQPPGEPGEPEVAAAKKQKRHKQKADGKGKHKQDKHKGNKKGRHKGDKQGKHKGEKQGKHKGDKQGKHKGDEKSKHKGDKKGKDKKDPQKQKSALRAASASASFASTTMAPVADAKVNEANPTLNYGSSPQLLVDGGADPDVESYLLFDVAGVTPPVQQATLRLWVQPNGGTQNGPDVRATGANWTETGLTWNTRPTQTSGALDDKGKLTGSTWVEYDVTAAVSGDGPVSFVLLPQTNDGAVFDSRETANPPELVVSFGEATPTPTPEPTATPTPTPEPTATPTPDPNATPTPTPEPTATSTPEPTATPTPEPTATPTPTPPPTSPLTVAPVADGRVSEASPTLNYGNSTQLLVDGGADPDVESYLRFVVSGVSPPVQQAILRLRVQTSGGTVDGPEVYPTGTNWTEGGLTWNTRPAQTGGALDDKGQLTGSTWVEYNVTAAVSGDGAYSFALVPETNDGAVFDSRETANPPQLVVTFGEQPPTPTPTPTPEPTATPIPTPTPTPDPNARVVMAAGDNVCGADSSGGSCKQMQTSDLILAADPDAVLVLGDVQYECGEASDFTSFYDPSWGRNQIKDVTRPSVGNHEYRTSTSPSHSCFGNPPNAQAYFDYFGTAAAGQVGQGYYSFDLGAWHLIALNSNCSFVGGCGVGSPQWDWLTADLAAQPPNSCTLAYWHVPLYSSGGRATTATKALYQALYDADADLVLTGHDHTYERFAPQDANGQVDNASGIREFVVGTGGRNLTSWGPPAANSEVKNNTTFGVLQLTLRPNSYDWQFVPIAGQSFTDSGSHACH